MNAYGTAGTVKRSMFDEPKTTKRRRLLRPEDEATVNDDVERLRKRLDELRDESAELRALCKRSAS